MRPYRIFNMSSGADEECIEAHVFARAYRGAWRAICGVEPSGRHEIVTLDLALDFGDFLPGGRHDH